MAGVVRLSRTSTVTGRSRSELKKQSKMQQKIYTIAKVLARMGVLMIALLSFIGILIVAMTQYPPFRKWAIEEGLKVANNAIAGEISVEDVRGNLITGLTVINARLEVEDTTFAFVPRISLQYHLSPILETRTVQVSVVLHNPEVYLHRNAAGVWNFSRIALPSDTTPSGPRQPLEWTFDIENLEMRDGRIRIEDEAASRLPEENPKLDFLHSRLRQVNLAMSGLISEEEQRVDIDHLSFLVEGSDVKLVDLAGNITVDDEGLAVDDLQIETGRSLLALNVSMDSVNLFDSALGARWMHYPFVLSLDAERVDIDELRRVIPGLDVLGGIAGLELEAAGTFGDIGVERLDLVLRRSEIHAQGQLVGLDDPEHLRIEAELTDSRLYNSDIPIYLVGIPMPDIDYLEEVNITRLSYSGTNRDAVSVFDLSTTVGSVYGGGWLTYGDVPRWKVDALIEEANPGPILNDDFYNGAITARLVAEGRGFDPQTMDARFRLRAGPVSLAERSLARLWVDGTYVDGGMLTMDTVMAAWGDASPFDPNFGRLESLEEMLQNVRRTGGTRSIIDRMTLSAQDVDIIDGLPSLRAGGWYDMRDPSLPKYQGHIETDRLNLADITLDPEQTTRLGLTLSVEGSGIEPDDMEGTAELLVTDASLPEGEELGPFSAEVLLEREGENRTLRLNSDILDAYLDGKWRFSTLFPTLAAGIEKLVNYVSRKGSYRDDLDLMLLSSDENGIESIVASYEFVPKDLSLLQAFMPGITLQGSITGTTQLLGITARGEIRRFLYRQGEQSVRFGGTMIDAEIRNITSGSMDDLLDAEISMTNDSLIHLNDMEIALPRVDLTFRDGTLHVNGATMIDNTYSIALDGRLNVMGADGYAVEMDTLIVGWTRGLQWRNADPVRFTLNDNGIDIESFRLYRQGAELFSVTGRFEDYRIFRDVRLSVAGTSLQSLQPLIVDPSTLEMIETLSGNLEEAEIILNGSLEDPVINAFLNVDDMRYTDIQIGDLELDLDYRTQNLEGIIRILRPLSSDTTADVALARVNIEALPIDLAFAAREERFISGRPVQITATTDDLPLAIFGPFTPGLLIQGGRADLDFTLEGTYPNVKYVGGGRIRSGVLTVESTNVPYTVDGRFDFRDNRLDIPGIVLRNLPTDYSRGVARINGNILFDGFVPERFDLNIRTESTGLLVLSDATQAVNDTYYGDLVIATRNQEPIHFGGSYEAPRLTGDIVVLASDLKYPYRATTANLGERVQYIDYAEWVTRQEEEYGPILSDEELRANDIKTPDELRGVDTTDRSGLDAEHDVMRHQFDSTRERAAPRGTFMDRLTTELLISLEEGVNVTVEIGPLQELTLRLVNDENPLRFWMRGNDMALRGTVLLQEGSQLLYFKVFDAGGSVTFEDDIANPSLDISGTYEGTRPPLVVSTLRCPLCFRAANVVLMTFSEVHVPRLPKPT